MARARSGAAGDPGGGGGGGGGGGRARAHSRGCAAAGAGTRAAPEAGVTDARARRGANAARQAPGRGASATCAVARAAMTLRGVEESEEPFPVARTSAGRWVPSGCQSSIVTANEF